LDSVSFQSESPEATKEFAAELGRLVLPGDVILLVGDLGAGKTVFAQGLALGLGYEGPVTSPTFTLVQEYRGTIPMLHADMYRLENLQDIVDLGLVELGELQEAAVVIEWGDMARPVIGPEYLQVRIEDGGDSVRNLLLDPVGQSWCDRLGKLDGK